MLNWSGSVMYIRVVRIILLCATPAILSGAAYSEGVNSKNSVEMGFPVLKTPSFRAKDPHREISIADDFEIIPEIYFHISGVERLVINNNRLLRVPKDLENFSGSLEELYINGTSIVQIDVDFGEFKRLKVLEINDTNISQMAINFEGMVALERLVLARNGSIDENTLESIGLNGINISNAANLRYLSITGSKISRLPEGLMYLTNLENVDFSGSCIKNMENESIVLKELFEESLSPVISKFVAPNNDC